MRRQLLAFLLFLPIALGAQDVPVGTLVRVVVPRQRAVAATFRAFSAESIHVTSLQGAPRSFALGEVRRVERSEGRRASAGAIKGMKIGAAVGAGATLAIMGTALLTADASEKGPGSALLLGGFVVGGAATGAMYGAVIGALARPQKWTAVPLPDGGRLSLKPMRGKRLGVAVTYAF